MNEQQRKALESAWRQELRNPPTAAQLKRNEEIDAITSELAEINFPADKFDLKNESRRKKLFERLTSLLGS